MNKKRSFNIKNKFKYWFDNKMAKGSLGFIRVLIIASIILAIIIAGMIMIFHFNEGEGLLGIIWNSISTIINASMPTFDEGSLGYLLLMSIVAIAGLLFTSVLIGIITSAIEEKIENLKKGNSLVLEKDHIVILGFYPGEYTLIRQLILAAAGKPDCIVIAEDMDRDEMEQYISDNIEAPKNFRIVCRTADITDPASLEKCSVETCRTIIISPTEDMRTIKSILAVSALLDEKGSPEVSVNAIISKDKYQFPLSIAEANNITTLQTNRILAKMIAHTCTQTGLSETFNEVFDFEGSEFYLKELTGINGITFEELMARTNRATPTGIYRDGKIIINPKASLVLKDTDKVLVFSEEIDTAEFESETDYSIPSTKIKMDGTEAKTNAVIIGHNETLPIILRELPENVSEVILVNCKMTKTEENAVVRVSQKRNLKIDYYDGNEADDLLEIAKLSHHIVILNDHDKEPEEADMDAIFLLLNLRDVRKRYNLDFNITMEMQLEHNQKLVGRGDHTDFLVASNMSSLILAQSAESPELIEVFREILSNEGNELFLKNAGLINLKGDYSVRDLRMIMLKKGYIFL